MSHELMPLVVVLEMRHHYMKNYNYLVVDRGSLQAVIVDPAGCKWLGEDIGCDIARHLGRHGAQVEVEQVASRGRPIAEVILSRAMQSASDLLVAGAKNPAHLKEILFGSATRTLLTKMPVPVLISR